jgi:hypothetical protein
VTTFYVSAAGSDTANGLADTTPWATWARVQTAITAGDVRQGDLVLFRRGDTFYDKMLLSAAATGWATTGDYCTFGAYGSALPQPVFSSYKNLNISGGWVLHAAGIWKLDLTNLASFTGYQGVTPSTGNQIPDGTHIGHLLVDGLIYGGRKFGADLAAALAALTLQWDFVSDEAQWLYVKSTANPTTLAADVRAATDGTGVVLGNSVKIVDLHFDGTGAHGAAGLAKHSRMFGCTITRIGGCTLSGYGDGTTRYGNGIELSIGSADWRSEHNYIEDVYDAGYTMQGPLSVGRIGWTNCHHRYNNQVRCSQNVEFWSQGTPETGSGAVDCYVQNNEFGTTDNRWTALTYRPGGGQGSRHIQFYDWTLGAERFHISFNTFRGQPALGQYHHMSNPPAGVTIDYNRVHLPAGTKLSGNTGEAAGVETTQTVEQWSAWTAVVGTELHSKFYVEPANPTAVVPVIQQVLSTAGRTSARVQSLERQLAEVAASLHERTEYGRNQPAAIRGARTLESSGGNQYVPILNLKVAGGSSGASSATFLYSESGDASLAMGCGIVHVKVHSGGVNNVRINLAVTELVPFPRGAGTFKASGFTSRLVATDGSYAHEIAVHYALTDTFQGLNIVPLHNWSNLLGGVRYWDKAAATGSVPADYSTGAPTVIKTNRYYAATPTAIDLAYAATVTPVASDAEVFTIAALTGNVTIGAPSGTAATTGLPYDGQPLTIRLTQDATGGRTVTWNAAFAFGTDVTAAMVPTTASAACEVMFRWHAATSKWRAVGIVRGF